MKSSASSTSVSMQPKHFFAIATNWYEFLKENIQITQNFKLVIYTGPFSCRFILP